MRPAAPGAENTSGSLVQTAEEVVYGIIAHSR